MNNEEVVKNARQICQAVDYAHQRGLIHRDLKPANVMLNVYGDSILMDFGIAKIMGGTKHTATGAVIGTAMYMSPEQIRGMEIDRRTDIYSLGVMLFEMVSGKPPFEADSAMTLMMMHVNDPVPDLRQLRPDLPQALVAVIEKAMAKDRNQRFQTAAEMASALEQALVSKIPVEYREPVIPRNSLDDRTALTEKGTPEFRQVTESGTVILDKSGANKVSPIKASQADLRFQQDEYPYEHTPVQKVKKKKIAPALLAAGAAGVLMLLCLVIGGFILIPRLFNGDATPTLVAAGVEPSATQTGKTEQTGVPDLEQAALLASTTTATLEPTAEPSKTLEPTATVEPTISPSPTFPTNYYVEITGIRTDRTYYIVDYATYGFTEQLPGTHIHFFFDTVSVEQAGVPGSGPWILYGGPRPFSQYRISDRPSSATMMCARVANPDHSLYDVASGNCYPLP
jgi:hypothetical protein